MSWRGFEDSASVPEVFISYIIERSLEESRRKWRGKLVGVQVIRDEVKLRKPACDRRIPFVVCGPPLATRWRRRGARGAEGKTVARTVIAKSDRAEFACMHARAKPTFGIPRHRVFMRAPER